MLKEWFSVREILEMQVDSFKSKDKLITKILDNKQVNLWQSQEFTEVHSNKPVKKYHIASLPTALKKAIIEHELKKDVLKNDKLNGKNVTKELLIAYTKLDLITSFRNSNLKLKEFCNKYNDRELLNIDYSNYLHVSSLTERTVYRWLKAYDKDGIDALKPKTALRKLNKSKFNTEDINFKELVIGMLLKAPHLKASVIYKFMQEFARKQSLQVPSYRIVCRYIQEYKTNNRQEYLYVKNPDAWKAKYMLALGNASERATAPNELWELDSSPADVLIDGGRYMLVACIDVYSRNVKFLVSKTSNSQAITSLLRACILEWGLPKVIKTDNGKDYKSKQISLFCNQFNIKQEFAKPFQGQEKPHVERVFKRLQHDILEALPSFVGHSVAERKAIEAVKTFEKRIFGNEKQAKITPKELQNFIDYWVQEHYLSKPHQGIKGKTPLSMLEGFKPKLIAEHKLYILDLLLEELKGTRQVGKKGIRVENANYFGYELASYVGKEVIVRVDRFDMGVIYVFDLNHNFICKAESLELLGKDKQAFAKQSKLLQSNTLKEVKAKTKKLINKSKKLDSVELLEYASTNNILESALEQAEEASKETYIYEQITESKQIKHIDEKEERYRKAKVLQAKIKNNEKVSQSDNEWLANYLNTPEYLAKRDREKALLDMFGQL